MSDIHQEWADLRKKNGEFICHLDGEMAKLEKAKHHQDLIDAIATARQFVAPPPISCCQDNSDILKAQCQAMADQIKQLEKKILAYKEKLDKATADFRALWVENDCLKDQLANKKAQCENVDDAYARLMEQNKNLKNALDQAAKDAEVSFNRGRIEGMEDIWDALKDVYGGRTIGENEKIFGYGTVGRILKNLSPTWFINRAEKYHEEEKKIHIGDEVEIFDTSCPDDDQHSDFGIVIEIGEDNLCFTVIGPKFEGCFNETDIKSGRVKKTGKHFDSVPLDYLA